MKLKIALIFLCLTVVFLVGVLFLQQTPKEMTRSEAFNSVLPAPTPLILEKSPSDVCGPDCREYIDASVARAIATISAQTNSASTKSTSSVVSQPKQVQTTYVPLSGLSTTTNTGWIDLTSTDVWIDAINDYGKNTYVTWDATIKTNGSGTVYARLYDATHNIAVDGSELSATSGSFTQVVSPRIFFWQGKNLYRVQIKSLDSNEVSFSSGRIKVVY